MGGLATRLHPITYQTPKSLIKVAGEPFIVHQLRKLNSQGINNVVLCVGYLGSKIEKFLKDGSKYGVKLKYSYDSQKLLGTGGAIKKALPFLGEEFFVLYGDSWLEINYLSVYKAFKRSGNKGLMTVYKNEGKWDSSNVEIENNIIKNYSKTNKSLRMTHIDYGLGIFNQSAFKIFDEGTKFDLAEVYRNLLEVGELASFESVDRFYEIGSHKGLMELNQLFNKTK